MLGKWLNQKTSGTGAEPKVAKGTRKTWATALLPLSKHGPKLGERALDYLMTGADPAVLADLRALPGPLLEQGTWQLRRQVLAAEAASSPALVDRFAQLLDAIQRGPGQAVVPPGDTGFAKAAPDLARAVLNYNPPQGSDGKPRGGLSHGVIAAVLAARELDPSLALEAALGHWRGAGGLMRMPGLREGAAAYPDGVRRALRAHARDAEQALRLLVDAGADFAPFLPELVALATGSAKGPRGLAAGALGAHAAAARPLLEEVAQEGSATARREAYRLLQALYADAAAFLEARRDAESAQKNRDVLAGLLAGPAADAPTPEALVLPPLPPVEEAPLSGAIAELIVALFATLETAHRQHYEAELARIAELKKSGEKVPHWRTRPPPKPADRSAKMARRLIAYLGQGKEKARFLGAGSTGRNEFKDFEGILKHPDLLPLQALRLIFAHPALLWRQHDDDVPRIAPRGARLLRAYRRAHGGAPDLRGLAQLVVHEGLDPASLAESELGRTRWNPGLGFDAADAWSFFAERSELLVEVLALRNPFHRRSRYYDPVEAYRDVALELLARFPALPPATVAPLWELALGSAKRPRLGAQRALATQPDRLSRVIAALDDGKQDVRATAARWLADIGDEAARAPLRQAYAKEKREVARGPMLHALAALGEDLDVLVSREGLAKEAKKKLAKGRPAKLAFFPLEALPAVRWASDGTPVDRSSLEWLLVQAHKLKSPRPTPLLRLYAGRFREDDAEELADFVFDAWLAEDTRTPTRAEVEPEVRRHAKQMLRWRTDRTEEELFSELLRERMGRPLGSANAHKGLLAVAAAGRGTGLAARAQRYLKDWHGHRAASCKMLLELLASRGDEASIQVLLATATRFRTKGIQKEADAWVQRVAEERGWTRGELADRTVPTAGFTQEAGRAVLELDLGPRTLRAALDEGLQVVIEKDGGKTSKSFPKPRTTDDEELAKAAKRTFSAAKKQVKAVVSAQEGRFYEAMCTGQRWDVPTWRRYLAGHPLVGRLCERLVWAAFDEGATATASFRPLGDGTFTNADDDELTLDAGWRIGVAHDSVLPPGAGDTWRAHLADYDVTPLFSQFGAEPYVLPETLREELFVDELEGHMLEAFALRALMQKHGYQRGPALDGGWFQSYHRGFPTLGIEAVLSFSGNSLPEENRPVALFHLSFRTVGAEPDPYMDPESGLLALGEVPPVLLSELRDHLRQAAALGTGHDPDWQKKVY